MRRFRRCGGRWNDQSAGQNVEEVPGLERLANELGARVLIVDKRPHIGGNAYDCHDAAGVLIHPYGPHIFHTNSADIFDYLSRFTEWRPHDAVWQFGSHGGDTIGELIVKPRTVGFARGTGSGSH